MSPYKSEDYKISAVQYLSKNKNQVQTPIYKVELFCLTETV